MKITYDINTICLVFTAAAFLVNIIVQMTKGFIPLPTKLWCILVAISVDLVFLLAGAGLNVIELNIHNILILIFVSFLVSFVAMYGFDTFKELWQRFKDGENINGDN